MLGSVDSRPCPQKSARGAGPSKPPSTPSRAVVSEAVPKRGTLLTGLFPPSSSKPARLLLRNGGVVRHAACVGIGTNTKRHEHQFSFPASVQPPCRQRGRQETADRSSTNPPRLFSHPPSCPRDSTTAHVASPVAPLDPFDRRLESLTSRMVPTQSPTRRGNYTKASPRELVRNDGRTNARSRASPSQSRFLQALSPPPHPHRRHPAPQGAKLRKRGCLTSLLLNLPPKTSGSLIDSGGRVDGQASSGIYDSVTALERRDPVPRRLVPP